jgi:ADP-heptose:LPS heptosyltransferase
MVFAAGIKTRIGYDRKWGFLLNKKIPKNYGEGLHEIEKNLALVTTRESKFHVTPCLSVGERSTVLISGLLKEITSSKQKFIAVHTGTSNPAKRWPESAVAAFCRLAQDRLGEAIVFIGGEEESAPANRIQSQLTGPSLNLAGRLSLKELVALFKHPQNHTLVSADSGPAHVAWMSGRPAVILYARNAVGSDPKRWGPRDNKSRVIFKNIGEITPAEVFETVKSLESQS